MLVVSRPCSDVESEIRRAIEHPPKAQCHRGWPCGPKAHSFVYTVIGRPPSPLSVANFMGFSVQFVLVYFIISLSFI